MTETERKAELKIEICAVYNVPIHFIQFRRKF